MDKLATLIERFNNGDRNTLAKLITLIESTAPSDIADKTRVLRSIQKCDRQTMRLAISGPPGVGKSTFINTLGTKLIAQGHSVAVLPIDPSSDISGGSVLADKTRMKELMLLERAYIRPSPSKGTLGGVAQFTSDLVFVVESFGFDVVIIETVGVGQSETLARMLADHFVLLMQPGAGDHVQAMKKGILEKADLILINKADGELEKLATQTKRTLNVTHAPHPGMSEHDVYINVMSGLNDVGVDAVVDRLHANHAALVKSGALARRRHEQSEQYFSHLFENMIANQISKMPSIKKQMATMISQTRARNEPISIAVQAMVQNIIKQLCSHDH